MVGKGEMYEGKEQRKEETVKTLFVNGLLNLLLI